MTAAPAPDLATILQQLQAAQAGLTANAQQSQAETDSYTATADEAHRNAVTAAQRVSIDTQAAAALQGIIDQLTPLVAATQPPATSDGGATP